MALCALHLGPGAVNMARQRTRRGRSGKDPDSSRHLAALCPDGQERPLAENTKTETHPLVGDFSGKLLLPLLRARLPLPVRGCALPLPAAEQARWTVCAEAGQVCRFNGEVLVPFGNPGCHALPPGTSPKPVRYRVVFRPRIRHAQANFAACPVQTRQCCAMAPMAATPAARPAPS